jgi:hypothetical protein
MAEEDMDPMKINDERSLTAWLSDKPVEWAQAIALRAALRALPYVTQSDKYWLANFALRPFGALVTSWTQLIDESIFVRTDESRSNARFGGEAFDFELYNSSPIAASAADASYHSAAAQSKSPHAIADCIKGVVQALEAFRFDSATQPVSGENGDRVVDTFWRSLAVDCNRLQKAQPFRKVKSKLERKSLWLENVPSDWRKHSNEFCNQLLSIDANYSVWIEWYRLRIRGGSAAFYISGDKKDVENKKILRRLSEATNEDFWGKGHKYVNATLKGWLDEARERVRPREVHALQATAVSTGPPEVSSVSLGQVFSAPQQDAGAIAFRVNEQGKLDRLPNSDQVHLRDVPDQRRAYDDLREAAAELLDEGQRLGHRLGRALGRFLQSLPERFEDAEAYLVWRDANALRRVHRAHREAAKSPEPDEAGLEPVIAEGLGGLLDLYNNFAFADDSLRAKDEARIAPQERASAEAEAMSASPLVDAILATPDIATPEALGDIIVEAENTELPADDPYAAQVLDQSNRTKRNWIAALLTGVMDAAGKPRLLGERTVIGIATGVGTAVGTVVTKQLMGFEYAALFEFVSVNAAALQSYVALAFSSFPNLPDLIERTVALWKRFRAP